MKSKYTTKDDVKEVVSLRKKPLAKGGYSLFLDYSLNGERTKEYLKMYLVPERNRIDRIQNEETLKTANAVKAKRTIEIQNGECGFRKRAASGILLSDYFDERTDYYRKRGSVSFAEIVDDVKQKCMEFKGDKTKLSQVKKDYLLGFIEHLRGEGLGAGSVYTYFACLNAVLNAAVRQRLIPENEVKYIDRDQRPKKKEPDRPYLTLDEVKRLASTPCRKEVIKRAFLFACFCGLRISDIETLTWDQIKSTSDGRMQIAKQQKKTKSFVYIPVSGNAAHYLGRRGKGLVFQGLPDRNNLGIYIKRWAKDAGIDKNISFHTSRHTSATLMLEFGVDLYTVSVILGHTNISTTQIYAKVIDRKRREAVDAIPDIQKG